VWENDRVEIIPNDLGNRTTPSYVAFTETERLIGDAAKNQVIKLAFPPGFFIHFLYQVALNPENTIFDAKRLIGRLYSDHVVKSDMKHWPFKVVEGAGGKPVMEVSFMGKTKRFTPEEVSAMVLVKMRETAEAYLGCAGAL
jgi:heat shock protein 1/8